MNKHVYNGKSISLNDCQYFSDKRIKFLDNNNNRVELLLSIAN